jgi:hypothetical protein
MQLYSPHSLYSQPSSSPRTDHSVAPRPVIIKARFSPDQLSQSLAGSRPRSSIIQQGIVTGSAIHYLSTPLATMTKSSRSELNILKC